MAFLQTLAKNIILKLVKTTTLKTGDLLCANELYLDREKGLCHMDSPQLLWNCLQKQHCKELY